MLQPLGFVVFEPLARTPFRRRKLDIENFVGLAGVVGRNGWFATSLLPIFCQRVRKDAPPRERRQRTPQAGRPPQAVRHQSRSDQPSSLITAEMSSVKTAEANRNRRQICALTPFRLASSCATISAEFGETFLPFIALPPKRAKSPYRWRGWAFRILAAAQLHAAMTAIAANSF